MPAGKYMQANSLAIKIVGKREWLVQMKVHETCEWESENNGRACSCECERVENNGEKRKASSEHSEEHSERASYQGRFEASEEHSEEHSERLPTKAREASVQCII